jgi:hypothetical protein
VNGGSGEVAAWLQEAEDQAGRATRPEEERIPRGFGQHLSLDPESQELGRLY